MKFTSIGLILTTGLLAACGLKYTPTETREDAAVTRKKLVNEYIRESYKDTNLVYQSMLFGQTTTIKPYIHRQLDSLYEIKYNNELRGQFDRSLEEKINNQKLVVNNSKDKVVYKEHHVYSIQGQKNSEIYFSEVTVLGKEITDFSITERYEIPTSLLAIFKSYITRESIVYVGYAPTSDELKFYEFFEEELAKRSIGEKNEFMNHMLTIFLLARQIKSVETRNILQHLSVIQVENRSYSSQVDSFKSINGVWDEDLLQAYEVDFKTPIGSFVLTFSPFFEVKDILKVK